MLSLPLVVLGVVLGQPSAIPTEAAIIGAAKKCIVGDIEKTLPRITFEAWLRGVVGPRAVMKWEVNDCGEQTGSSADRGRDFPVCAEVQVGLTENRQLSISLAVGTVQKGLWAGPPQLFDAYVDSSSPSVDRISITKLTQVQTLIGQ